MRMGSKYQCRQETIIELGVDYYFIQTGKTNSKETLQKTQEPSPPHPSLSPPLSPLHNPLPFASPPNTPPPPPPGKTCPGTGRGVSMEGGVEEGKEGGGGDATLWSTSLFSGNTSTPPQNPRHIDQTSLTRSFPSRMY